MSVSSTIEALQGLEDNAILNYVKNHNDYLKKIEAYEVHLNEGALLGRVELAKMEYWYSYAQRYAYLISGYYRKQQKYYEAHAEIQQANMYENVKLGKYNDKLSNSTDAQYLSRRAKGEQLELASHHEGNFKRWEGIALSYESAINSIKDMVKGGRAEERGNTFE